MEGLSLLFAGDVYQPRLGEAAGFDPALLKRIRGYGQRICNFEAPVPGGGDVPSLKAGPTLRQSVEAARLMRGASFNRFCLGNNHCMDWGLGGLRGAMEALGPEAVFGAGEDERSAYAPAVMEENGLRAAVLAGCERQNGAQLPGGGGGYAWIGHPDFDFRVEQLKRQYDFVFVYAHAGLERVLVPLPYWRQRYRQLVDRGADGVIASHPHVLQGLEIYQGAPILYGLGDLLWDGQPRESLLMGLTLQKGKPVQWERIPVRSREGRVALAPEEEGARLIAAGDEALASPAYERAAREAALGWMEAFGRDYLRSAVGYAPGGALVNLKNDVKRLIRWRGGEKMDPVALEAILHNETIRETILLALT